MVLSKISSRSGHGFSAAVYRSEDYVMRSIIRIKEITGIQDGCSCR